MIFSFLIFSLRTLYQGKNFILDVWPGNKSLWRYEVKFLHVEMHFWKQQIYLVISVVVVRYAWACPKLSCCKMMSVPKVKNELSCEVGFLYKIRYP